MAGVSGGTSTLLANLASRARQEVGEITNGVSMAVGAELPSGAGNSTEEKMHAGAVTLRAPVAETPIDSTNAHTALREIALLAAHERAVQRMAMSRMRTIAMYRLRLMSRPALLERGIAEGLVPL